MKKTIISLSVCAVLSACGGGGDIAEVSPAKTSASTIIMNYDDAKALRSADSSLPEGYARYIVKMNPAADVDTSSVIMQQQSIDGVTSPEFAAKVLKIFDETAMSSHSASTSTMLPNSSAFVMEVPIEKQAVLLEKLSTNPAIAEIIPDQVISLSQDTAAIPSFNFDTSLLNIDPSYWWHLDRIDQKTLPLNKSYVNSSVASNVNVYVVDSGVSPHNELKTLKPGFGALSDGYGTADCFGHGTGVASHIAGQNVGVSGSPSIYPVRVMGCAGTGVMSDLAKGFEWVLANAKRPAVVNMSLGGAATTFIDDYVRKMIDKGFTVVSAAGNDNKNACGYSPARVAEGITVGATTIKDTRASFSNFGSCVSIFAPGENIVAAHKSAPNAYALVSGTSFASPITAGIAALILQQKPDWAPSSVKNQLIYQSSKSVVTNSSSATSNLVYALPGTIQNLPNANMGYVHSLVGAKATSTGGWKQTVTITLRNSLGAALPNTQVIGYFSNSTTPSSCTTSTSGVCVVSSNLTTAASLNFKVDTLRQSNVIYRPDLNKQISVTTNK